MSASIIAGKAIAADIRRQLTDAVTIFHKTSGIRPHLAAVLVGEDPASAVYVRNKQRACEQVGIRSTLHQLGQDTTQAELLCLVADLNSDSGTHGILIQLPLPSQIGGQAVLDAVLPAKDVDCFHAENVGLMVQGRPRFLPCTPHGVQQLLLASGTAVAGSHAVVLGRSDIVGKPMGMMLVQRGAAANATVTICHSQTADLTEKTRQADILVAAIGQPHFVTADMVKPGAVVVDVGINRLDGKLTGDVDYEAVREVASAITPVPGGVGPMTIAMLLKNTLTAAQLQAQAKNSGT